MLLFRVQKLWFLVYPYYLIKDNKFHHNLMDSCKLIKILSFWVAQDQNIKIMYNTMSKITLIFYCNSLTNR